MGVANISQSLGNSKIDKILLSICMLFYTIVVAMSLNNPFFWDNVLLGSKAANYFYSQDLATMFLRPSIDPGHPTLFSYYIAIGWKLIFKHLWVGHLLMLPILWGIVFHFHILCKQFLSPMATAIAMLLLLIEPTLLAQATMVSPDLLLVFGFLMALNGIIKQKKWIVIVGCILLSMSSLRGIMLCMSLFIVDLLLHKKWKHIVSYLPAAAVVMAFYGLKYNATGCLLVCENSEWAGGRGLASFKGLIKNAGVIGWRFLDFGRIGLWLVAIGIIAINFNNKIPWPENLKSLFKIFAGAFIPFFVIMVLMNNPIGHRYFIPFFLIFIIAVSGLIASINKFNLKVGVVAISALILITGHLWIYPPTIAQGWDSSLAHVSFFKLDKELEKYMQENKIFIKDVATEFPITSSFNERWLTHNKEKPVNKDQQPIENFKYILNSNVINDFTDEELAQLKNWPIEWTQSKNKVFLTLHKNPNYRK